MGVIGKGLRMVSKEKVNRKIRYIFVKTLRNKEIYKYCYKSYWHYLLHNKNIKSLDEVYFAARPNPGAGIGHQMANWIAGYWYAKKFNLKFAHIPFSSKEWEDFLGFYQNEEIVDNLKDKGYKVVRIQDFDENNVDEVERIKNIINSYGGTKTILLAEQDQFYHDQYGVINAIQDKFYTCSERKNNKLIYSKDAFNIAIHVRRGDIVQKPEENNSNLSMRYQDNSYFVNALNTALNYVKNEKNIHIYIFSQGNPEDFKEFLQYNNIHFCLDMNAKDSFLHMVYADALITSKSSFSYKPALLNKSIKFVPNNFWHGYPKKEDWIILDEKGNIKE